MEIERKWFVGGWPTELTAHKVYHMEQGYISVRPTVRIRREAQVGASTEYILCFKGRGRLSREEIETEIDETLFSRLSAMLGCPLIHKERRDYLLRDGRVLEVNLVDEGLPTAFFYAEIEFRSEEEALSWSAASVGLEAYLSDEVTQRQGVSMGSYWEKTRHADI